MKYCKFKLHYVQHKKIENIKHPSLWIKIIDYLYYKIILVFDYYAYYTHNTCYLVSLYGI